MGRISDRGGSYGHSCCRIGKTGMYEISWVVDYYYSGTRARHPRCSARTADLAGAKRFCKRWKLPAPDEG